MTEKTLKIAIKTPLYRVFDYLPPKEIDPHQLAPGTRVRVPFGRRSVVGLVWEPPGAPGVARDKLRAVQSVLDSTPVLDASCMRLLHFASDYYQHAPGDVVAAALPQLLKEGRDFDQTEQWVCASEDLNDVQMITLQRRAPKQAELAKTILAAPDNSLPKADIEDHAAMRALLKKGLLRLEERDCKALVSPHLQAAAAPEPSDAQAAAIKAISAGFGAYNATLLDGVTGSGKTEVYLRLIEELLAKGQQVLVLVPEIGLTPQLHQRFAERLGRNPAVLHSGLNDSERMQAFRSAADGDADVLIGTRSAIFCPLPRLGLIIVDEEHDASLKQQEGFRYHARDLALVRARDAKVPVVLGSATPSLESLANLANGRLDCCELPSRVGSASPPKLRLIDLNTHGAEDGLSGPLRLAMDEHLGADGQVLIYINRRGFAPTLLCADCGHICECPSCDARLTLHANAQQLRCHHCGYEQNMRADCTECGGGLRALGEGSERVETALRRLFPGENILRIDSDTTRRKGAFEDAYNQARSGAARILVGTQMLSKGHHFPKLSLVGVLNIDQGLFGGDFRTAERLAQSLIQVAGRAGRTDDKGEVLIQTEFANHPQLNALLREGYRAFANEALAERKSAAWPPYASMALLRAQATDKQNAWAFLEEAGHIARAAKVESVSVYGPVKAAMERRAGRFRSQLLLHSTDRRELRRLLKHIRPQLDALASGSRTRWSLDVDPIDLL